MKEYPCANCHGKVVYTKSSVRGLSGWGHVMATGCIKPAVSMKVWKQYLVNERTKKVEVAEKEVKNVE